MKKAVFLIILALSMGGMTAFAYDDYRCRYEHGYGPTYYSGGYLGYVYGYNNNSYRGGWDHHHRHHKYHGYYDRHNYDDRHRGGHHNRHWN
jgi:hypothetical protein